MLFISFDGQRKLLLRVAGRATDSGQSVPFPTTDNEDRVDDSRRSGQSSSEENVAEEGPFDYGNKDVCYFNQRKPDTISSISVDLTGEVNEKTRKDIEILRKEFEREEGTNILAEWIRTQILLDPGAKDCERIAGVFGKGIRCVLPKVDKALNPR